MHERLQNCYMRNIKKKEIKMYKEFKYEQDLLFKIDHRNQPLPDSPPHQTARQYPPEKGFTLLV